MIIYILIILIVIFFIYFSTRHSWWRKKIDYSYPRILMYHMISEHLPKKKSKFNRLRVKSVEFEKQLKWLNNNNWKSYKMSELISLDVIPEKSYVITFDDGYRDNYLNAFPLLKKHNIKATLYLIVNRFSDAWALDKDTNSISEELNNEEMLSDDEIIDMINSGLIEIGSHTLNHCNLKDKHFDKKKEEIYNSKIEIEKKFNINCESFAYPFGFYSKNDWKIVEEAGYSSSVTVQSGVEDIKESNKFLLKRIMVSGRQGLLDFILKMKNGRNR